MKDKNQIKETELGTLEAAAILGVNDSTISYWARKGQLPHTYKNSVRVFKWEHINQVKIAREKFGPEWFKKVNFNKQVILVKPAEKVQEHAVPSNPTSSTIVELSKMAKTLRKMGENDLAARVSLRMADLM